MNRNNQPIEAEQPAPDFKLEDAGGTVHSLSDYRGKWVVLYFYPKDNTPGCTIEACHFRDDSALFAEANAVLIGINTDNAKRHRSFVSRYSLPFTLLIDKNGEVSQTYGALFKLGPVKFSKRHTFIINPEGFIAKIYRSVSPGKHSRQILEEIKFLKKKDP